MENYNGLESGFNNKEGIKENTQNNADDGHKKINEKEPQEDIKKRFKFYYTNKSTKNNLVLPQKEKTDAKNNVLDYREVTPNFKKENLKTLEFEKRIDIVRERVINFGKERGLNLSERLISNDDIYLLMENKYKKLAPKETAGIQFANEILLRHEFSDINHEDIKELCYNAQHELLHSACIKKVTVKKDNELFSRIFHREKNFKNIVSSGYNSFKGKLRNFNEFLTEITNVQIYLDSDEDYNIPRIAWLEGVIFMTELIDDIAKKTNRQRENVLTEFQIGMFEGKREKLKIIKDLYGGEALNKLINMKNDKKSILETAKIFGVISNVKKKIEDMENGKEYFLNIGNNANVSMYGKTR